MKGNFLKTDCGISKIKKIYSIFTLTIRVIKLALKNFKREG